MRADTPFLFGVSEFTTNLQIFEEDIALYADLGVGAVEVCEAKLDDGRFAAQMASVGESGLRITSVQPVTRTLFPSKSQSSPTDIGERMARFRRSVERLSPFTPSVAYVTNTGIPPGGDIQRVIDTAIREYRALAEHAQAHGVTVALEPLNPSIANIETAVWTVAQAMEIIRAVDHPAFGLCLDSWNVWQNADLYAQIRDAGAKIFVVQLSDWRTPRSFQDRVIPGQGQIPLAPFLRAVREAGFTGAYSLEIFSNPELPDSLWTADPRQVVVDSRRGIEAAWQQSFQV